MKYIIFTLVILSLLLSGCQASTHEWKGDGIILMQHESEGYYNCFGCNIHKTPGLCIDPSGEMKQVPETQERYCNQDFEVVEIKP